MQKYLGENFVCVWIEDKKGDDGFAQTHGLSGQGYPNLPIWDADGELVGRVIGFGGKDPWFAQVKAAVANAAKIRDAKERASKDPAANADLAEVLAGIPDREKDALAAYGKVPADRKDVKVKAAETALRAKTGWGEVSKWLTGSVNDLASKLDRNDKPAYQAGITAAFKKVGPAALEKIDAWLKEFGDAAKDSAPGAWLTKANVLLRMEEKEKAAAALRALLEKFADSREARQAKAMLEKIEKELAPPPAK